MIALLMLKCAFHSECESDTMLSGRRVVRLGLLSKELADRCSYCNASFIDIDLENHTCLKLKSARIYGKPFTGDMPERRKKWLFSPKQGW